MQILKKLNWLSLVSIAGLLLSSCLKDKGYDNGEYQLVSANGGTTKGEWVSIPKATSVNVLAVDGKPGAQDINLFEVSYDFVNPASTDITITMQLNNTLVTAASTVDKPLIILPAAAYTIPVLTLTIPAGQRLSNTMKIKLTTDLVPDPTKVYAIGMTIASTSKAGVQIPSNLKDVVYAFTVKNRFDGEYTVTGTMVDAANANISGYFPMKYWLITTGANTVDGFDPVVWGDRFVPIRVGTSVSGYGSYSPIFTFNASNQITSVVNFYGQPAGNGRYAQLDPSGINTWDPVTKTIKVKFFMFHPSVIPLPDPRVRFNWTMTYVKPRP